MPAPFDFVEALTSALDLGQAHYGEIGVSRDGFAEYVWGIVLKHLQDGPDGLLAIDFAKKLHLRDLYLTCGCVQGCETAWQTLDIRYRKFVIDLARFCYRQGADNEEIADAVLVSLCLPDRSGRRRIASYDGRSSLATWLRVIVVNRAINQQNEQRIVSEESSAEVPDARALADVESSLYAGRYHKALEDSLTEALRGLTERDRLMLLWRYEENMPLGKMAKLLGIHQSNVTRQLVHLQTRLRQAIVCALSEHHNLSPSAIAECLSDTVDNPQLSVSLIDLIKLIPLTIPERSTGKRAAG